MTRKNKKYQLLISTLLLCFLQMAGIDVYAQAPVTPVQKDTTLRTENRQKPVHEDIVTLCKSKIHCEKTA